VRLSVHGPVNSLTRITLEYNGKIRPQPDGENAFARAKWRREWTLRPTLSRADVGTRAIPTKYCELLRYGA
jgi:hypothetical protein